MTQPPAGAPLAEAFYRELVGPLLGQAFPQLRHAAGRLGSGSDVLGLDDAMSRDHDWGCRLTLLVDDADQAMIGPVAQLLERELPDEFAGQPVRFPVTWQPTPSHQVEVATVPGFVGSRLGVDPRGGLSSLQWLSLTGHGVLEAVGGPVFVDDTIELQPLRELLRWYPPAVERFVLAAGWERVAQRLSFVGRTGQTGQPLGSRLIASRLAVDLMRQAFLLERQWPPYEKWLEALFRRLPVAAALLGPLTAAVEADSWQEREDGLVAAIEALAGLQRERGLPTPEQSVTQFFDRPYRSVHPDLVALLLADVDDPQLAGLPLTGAIEQWVDSPVVLARPENRPAVIAAWQAWQPAR